MSHGRISWMDILEVVAIGFPFCGFKILTGLHFVGESQPLAARALGALLLALGALDVVINALNLGSLLARQRRLLSVCVLSTFLPRRKWGDLGDSLDVLLSFSIVAFVVGSGITRYVSADHLPIWNACVVLNVLGAGLSRFGTSVIGLVSPAPTK